MNLEQRSLDDKVKTISPVILNVSKKILNRESIFRGVDNKMEEHIKDLKDSKKQSKLTDEQIVDSSIYAKL